MKRFPPNSSFCQEHGSMSVSAQFSSETSAVSKEVANLSLNLSPYSFWSMNFSILPSCAKKSHWNSDPNTYLPKPGEITKMKYFYEENMICAVHQWFSLMVCGLQAGHAERADCTALSPLPLLPTLALGAHPCLICEVAEHSQKCHGTFIKHGRAAAAFTSSQTQGGGWEPQWSHLWTCGLALPGCPTPCSRRGAPAVLCVHSRGYFSTLHLSITKP